MSIIYNKKRISSTKLRRRLELRQKTRWLFKLKAMKAVESSHMEVAVEVDETYIGGQDDEFWGCNESCKKNAVIAIEKKGRMIIPDI